jgi:hypothetical protein
VDEEIFIITISPFIRHAHDIHITFVYSLSCKPFPEFNFHFYSAAGCCCYVCMCMFDNTSWKISSLYFSMASASPPTLFYVGSVSMRMALDA